MNELETLKKENNELKEKVKSLEERLNNKKNAMGRKAQKGFIMNRPAFGYKIENGVLVPSEMAEVVENMFIDFNENNFNLSALAKKYGFSVNGIKKILTNFSYLGKIKFGKETYHSSHKPLISSILFNHVQDKLERMGIKK